MPIENLASSVDIAISGMRAQSLRMNVAAENIANSDTSRAADGKPYRRKFVVLSAQAGGGVNVDSVASDTATALKTRFMPAHPDADEAGNVHLPNVDLATEMVNLVVASRSYEANAAVLKRYEDGSNAALELLR